jgi:hypothetical protein
MYPGQGEQIGRIFAYWAIVYTGHLFENYGSSPTFGDTILNGKSSVLMLTKMGLTTCWSIFSPTHLGPTL